MADEKKDNAKLLVGKWEVTKVDAKADIPVGTVLEFSKDGKAKITLKEAGKVETTEVRYELEGTKITLMHKPVPEGKKSVTIKKLTEKELIVDEGKGVVEFRRKE